jgi:hypothetical protein
MILAVTQAYYDDDRDERRHINYRHSTIARFPGSALAFGRVLFTPASGQPRRRHDLFSTFPFDRSRRYRARDAASQEKHEGALRMITTGHALHLAAFELDCRFVVS